MASEAAATMVAEMAQKEGHASHETQLFGNTKDWDTEQWTASDDRVRGGRSQSYLTVPEDKETGVFNGNLDITALGGAGFASQRTTEAAGGPWDLSKADGLTVAIGDVDERIYTLVLKNDILPKRPDGREQSTVSYEFSLQISGNPEVAKTQDSPSLPESQAGMPCVIYPDATGASGAAVKAKSTVLFAPWSSFTAYYRGKKMTNPNPLDTTDIKRISIMCRSMFGVQHGDFSVSLESLSATTCPKSRSLDFRTLKYRYIENGSRVFYFYNKSWAPTQPIEAAEHSTETSKSTPQPVLKESAKPQAKLAAGERSNNESDWDFIDDLEELKIEERETAVKRRN